MIRQSPFANPQVTKIARANMKPMFALRSGSTPAEIRIPVGQNDHVHHQSDVQHGFKVNRTNVNVMVLPGQVSKRATFTERGLQFYLS